MCFVTKIKIFDTMLNTEKMRCVYLCYRNDNKKATAIPFIPSLMVSLNIFQMRLTTCKFF